MPDSVICFGVPWHDITRLSIYYLPIKTVITPIYMENLVRGKGMVWLGVSPTMARVFTWRTYYGTPHTIRNEMPEMGMYAWPTIAKCFRIGAAKRDV